MGWSPGPTGFPRRKTFGPPWSAMKADDGRLTFRLKHASKGEDRLSSNRESARSKSLTHAGLGGWFHATSADGAGASPLPRQRRPGFDF